jgi:hypothetical protein
MLNRGILCEKAAFLGLIISNVGLSSSQNRIFPLSSLGFIRK